MAEYKVGPFVDELLRRTRDPQAGGTDRAGVRLLLGHAQRILNAATASVLVEREFTLEPKRVLYDLDEVAQVFLDGGFVALQGIHCLGQSLTREAWDDVARLDAFWIRRYWQFPHTWAVKGNLFLVYPGVSVERLQVTLVLVQLTPLFDSDDSDVLLPKEVHSRLLDLGEALIFLRRRQPLDVMKALLRSAVISVMPDRPIPRVKVLSGTTDV